MRNLLVILVILFAAACSDKNEKDTISSNCKDSSSPIAGCWLTDVCDQDTADETVWKKAVYYFKDNHDVEIKYFSFKDSSCTGNSVKGQFIAHSVYELLGEKTLDSGLDGWSLKIASEEALHLAIPFDALITTEGKLCSQDYFVFEGNGLMYNPAGVGDIDYSHCLSVYKES
ncbi:MAG: hypothetical protein OEY38_23670 [Gammaproteobacteria bacterium]|nr:hypothetical protein [Gammaproteobacteria bacterium]